MNYRLFLRAVFILLFFYTYSFSASADESKSSLSQGDIISLSKSSVVRVMRNISGEVAIPALHFDLTSKSIVIDDSRPGKVVPIDETFVSSGFIVSSDGYVVTNSHVVSSASVVINASFDSVIEAIYSETSFLNENELKNVVSDELLRNAQRDIFDYVSSHNSIRVKDKTVVLNPSSSETDFSRSFDSGFESEIVFVNDHFFIDDKDIAILRIDQFDLPTVPLKESSEISTGKELFLIGFPASAEFNRQSVNEATFTKGMVNAVKRSVNGDFPVFQVDAKVSEGSSGGPLIDSNGNVIGILSFQSGHNTGFLGDNFAFALPSELIIETFSQLGIPLHETDFRRFLSQGLFLFKDRHCQSALPFFNQAKHTVNEAFLLKNLIDSYENQCRVLLSERKSLDSFTDRFVEKILVMHYANRIALLSSLAFGLALCFTIWRLILQVKREEKEIQLLREELRRDEEEISKNAQAIRGNARNRHYDSEKNEIFSE